MAGKDGQHIDSHLFVQVGEQSHLSKGDDVGQFKGGSCDGDRCLVDAYQRLNYIQQVCLQERNAA